MLFDDDDPDREIEEKEPILLRFAPAWKRVLSYTIDLLIVGIIAALMLSFAFRSEISFVVKEPDISKQQELAVAFYQNHEEIFAIVTFILQLAYFALFWTSRGQTVGAMLFKIAVIDMKSRNLNLVQSAVRYLVLLLSAYLYYLPLLFVINPIYHQRLQDVLSGSVVVEIPVLVSKDEEKTQAEA